MAEQTTEQKIEKLTFYDEIGKLKSILTDLEDSSLTPSATIAVIPASTNLPAVPATFADLAAARTAVEAQRAAVEARLDTVEAKINEVITKLKTAGIISE